MADERSTVNPLASSVRTYPDSADRLASCSSTYHLAGPIRALETTDPGGGGTAEGNPAGSPGAGATGWVPVGTAGSRVAFGARIVPTPPIASTRKVVTAPFRWYAAASDPDGTPAVYDRRAPDRSATQAVAVSSSSPDDAAGVATA